MIPESCHVGDDYTGVYAGLNNNSNDRAFSYMNVRGLVALVSKCKFASHKSRERCKFLCWG